MIKVDQLNVRLGSFALDRISFHVPAGEYAVLMGRTGSGKTTLLETICGLRPVAGGDVYLHGEKATWLPARERRIGYVPQDRALFMTMTVRENLEFGLRVRGQESSNIATRVAKLAELLAITPLLDRKPHDLSGGEAQRVALGRALALEPRILCLDEPLSALDDETRTAMHSLLRAIHAETKATVLHVTHHFADARQLATRLFRFKDGAVIEEPL
jgi:ABC-type sugar transport system ATPase subunit